MPLEAGSVVAIRHYSMINVFTAIVAGLKDKAVEVKLPKDCRKSTFQRGDPLVFAYENRESAEIKGGRVIEFNREKELLSYLEDENEEYLKMRSYERYPVSLYADYRVVEEAGSRKYFALVKDISDFGVMIYSVESHFKGLRLSMDIYLIRDILSLEAEIVRKVEHDGYFEYGLKIRHSGPFVFNRIKNYVRKLHEELLSKFSE